jgi:adenine C2-methylase RlmN of 23S rRNA A2503 and tRNA A37
MAGRRIISDSNLARPKEFPREDNQIQETEQVNDNLECREYLLNTLKNLKSKMKKLANLICNSNNYTGYSIFASKSEEVETDFSFMGVKGYKVLFK